MFSCYFPSLYTPQMNVNVVKATVFHTNEQHKVLRNIWVVAKLISNSVLLNYILSHNANSFNVTENAHCMGHQNVTFITFYQTWGMIPSVSWLLQLDVLALLYTQGLFHCAQLLKCLKKQPELITVLSPEVITISAFLSDALNRCEGKLAILSINFE